MASLLGCVPAIRNVNGFYDYSYCKSTSGQKSILAERMLLEGSKKQDDSIYLEGFVKDINDKKAISGGLVNIESANYSKRIYADEDGYFKILLPEGKYSFKTSYLGYSNFEISEFPMVNDQRLIIHLGKAGSFTTYAVTSRHKLMKWQLKSAVNRIIKKSQKLPTL